jgi:thiamine pyrophosphate-dependent acetolactate synthase large subunit-like protein
MLISNGQQTMGVGLPWGIAASIVHPGQKVVSVSGDGGFMMSSMELETAVRLKSNLVHVVWVDQGFNMVEMQERKKYGRGSGVEFGPIDFAAYARLAAQRVLRWICLPACAQPFARPWMRKAPLSCRCPLTIRTISS